MHTRAIASQRAINDRWRSAGWESLILPGHTANGGWRGEARAAREDVFGAEPRQVRAESAGLLPPPTSLSVQAFSSRRERVHRGFADDVTNSFEIQY